MKSEIGDYDNPTLAMVALDLSNKGGLGRVSQSDVSLAARRRNVAIKDGRVPRDGLADIYFELRTMEGLSNHA